MYQYNLQGNEARGPGPGARGPGPRGPGPGPLDPGPRALGPAGILESSGWDFGKFVDRGTKVP